MSVEVIKDLKPSILWERFYGISQIPRPSKKEEKILAYLKNLCNDLNVKYKQDKIGNLLITVPATPGKEQAPVVVLQAHVDMVCEKNKDTQHDFDNDPIKLIRTNGWLKAEGTTLGSDNGVGAAAALA
jgi:dipeptidase D